VPLLGLGICLVVVSVVPPKRLEKAMASAVPAFNTAVGPAADLQAGVGSAEKQADWWEQLVVLS